MNLRHLEHWLALADTGSFSRAAEKLHITQSALSRSIQALEEDLGGPLVDRIGKRNELTPLGHSVMARARRIVHEAAELRQGAALLQEGGLGHLRLGLGAGPGAMLMTPWLLYMAQNHPTVKVSIYRGATELQLVQLRERQLDALVIDVRRVVPAPDLNMESFTDMRAGFLCRAGHPLLHKSAVRFDALRDYPIASSPLSQEVSRIMVAHYGAQADPEVMTTLQCEELASLIAVVKQTDAIFLGIVGAARAELASGALVELPMDPPFRSGARLSLITLVGRTELPIMSEFRHFVTQHLSDTELEPS
jgi:DNA-binding transcriptional LysR family regulator